MKNTAGCCIYPVKQVILQFYTILKGRLKDSVFINGIKNFYLKKQYEQNIYTFCYFDICSFR
jgi:hypothetical protein